MKSKIIFLVTLIMFVSLVSAIPQTFNVHGRLSNSSGIMTGIYEMNFSLYDVYTGGSYLWMDLESLNQENEVKIIESHGKIKLNFEVNV